MDIKKDTRYGGAGRESMAQSLGPDRSYQQARPPRGNTVGFPLILCLRSGDWFGQADTVHLLQCFLLTGPPPAAGSEGRAGARCGEAPAPTSPSAPAPPRPLDLHPAALFLWSLHRKAGQPSPASQGCAGFILARKALDCLWQKVLNT